MSLRAVVRAGQIVRDDDAKLPDGTVLRLEIDDEGLALTPEDKANLDAAICEALDEADAGQTIPASEILSELRTHGR